ncbi:hypothetical protein Tco_0950365 [Tanacetum coccineum]
MIEPEKPLKKKDLIRLDKEIASKLQAEFDEDGRLEREKDEANVALTKEWDDIQAKIKVDHELAQRLQAEEQEELFVKEKANLFQQLLEQRRKHFAAKKGSSKRSREELEQESTKKQKVYEDKDTAELQSLMKSFQYDEEFELMLYLLAHKSPSIVDERSQR